MKTLSWLNWALGVWLVAATFVLTTGNETVRAEEAVAGIAIAVLAYTSAVRPTPGLSWSVAIAGLWAVIVNSGVMMTKPRLNAVIVGALVAVLGGLNALYRSHHDFHRIGSSFHSRGSRR
jgi:hypothetical protein